MLKIYHSKFKIDEHIVFILYVIGLWTEWELGNWEIRFNFIKH